LGWWNWNLQGAQVLHGLRETSYQLWLLSAHFFMHLETALLVFLTDIWCSSYPMKWIFLPSPWAFQRSKWHWLTITFPLSSFYTIKVPVRQKHMNKIIPSTWCWIFRQTKLLFWSFFLFHFAGSGNQNSTQTCLKDCLGGGKMSERERQYKSTANTLQDELFISLWIGN
jgi:hypothetical protein